MADWTSEITVVCSGPSNQCFGHVDSDAIAAVITANFFSAADGFGTAGSIAGSSHNRQVVGALVHDDTDLVVVLQGPSLEDLPVTVRLSNGVLTADLVVADASASEIDGNVYIFFDNLPQVIGSDFNTTEAITFLGTSVQSDTIDFNCSCETESGFQTLAELRRRMMVRLGYAASADNPPPGMNDLLTEFLVSAQRDLYAQYNALRTGQFFLWRLSAEAGRFYGITANGDGDEVCLKGLGEIDLYKITWVGIEDSDGVWYDLIRGIDPAMYTRLNSAGGSSGRPTHFEIRSCIEIFPKPDANYNLWIKGHFGLESFEEDDDRTTIDSELVFLLALGNAKGHYKQADANSVLKSADRRIQNLVAFAHQTARYVPRPRSLQQPTQQKPIFIPAS